MNILKLYLGYALFSVFFIQSSEIIVRPAEIQDLHFMAALSKKIITEDFREVLINGYPTSPVIQNPELLHTYLMNMVTAFEGIFEEKELYDSRQRLFVATSANEPIILGLCFSQQISEDQAYIRYIAVDKNCRHQGVGRALITETLNSYTNITSCELKTFSHANDHVHIFYEKYGFVSDKIPVPLLRKLSEHSDSITYILYHLDIKK